MAERPKDEASKPAAAPTHGAAEFGLRSIDAVTGMARQNIETVLSVAHGAVQGFEDMTTELAAFSRANFDRMTSAAQAMTAATSPADLLKLQTDFSRQQVEATMAEMTKLSHVMIKTAREALSRSIDSTTPRGGNQ